MSALQVSAGENEMSLEGYTRTEYNRKKSAGSSPAFYVQGITGYSGCEQYEYRAGQLTAAGFVRLRSEKGDNSKYWEIWYLANKIVAEGQIAGFDERQILEWLMFRVGVGSIAFEGEHWGAAAPD